eukprot:COSAG05_NODE_698_length_7869_cov_639.155727_1_plen_273_part_00
MARHRTPAMAAVTTAIKPAAAAAARTAGRQSIFMSWATRASDWARRNPRTSAGVAAAIMGGSGDLVAQKIEMRSHRAEQEAATGGVAAVAGAGAGWAAVVTTAGNSQTCQGVPVQQLNFSRAFAMASFCTFMGTVVYVPFFFAMDKYIGAGRTLSIVAQKVAVNQLIVSPVVDLPIYFSWTGYLDGLSLEASWKRFTTQYCDTLFGTWAIWTPVGFFNFAFVPLHLRVPVAYAGEFIWSITVSYLSHRPIEEDDNVVTAVAAGVGKPATCVV